MSKIKSTKKEAGTSNKNSFQNFHLELKALTGLCPITSLESDDWLENIHAEAEAFALSDMDYDLPTNLLLNF